MIFRLCPGLAWNRLASKWASLSLVSSRQTLHGWISSRLTWGGCGAASRKKSKTPTVPHTLTTVSGRGDLCRSVRNLFSDSSLFFPFKIWKLRTSPWASCVTQTSPRWPGAWSTHSQLAFRANATLPAGMPSCFGFLSPTSLRLSQTLLSECFFLHPGGK